MTTTPTDPVVQIFVQGTGWVDITADTRLNSAHSGGGIDIARGEPNEGSTAEPTSIGIVINNKDGKYSPRNPSSPYFGKIGRNTPIRIGMRQRIDTFNGRTVSNGWGNASDGKGGWTTTPSVANFSVSGGTARLQAQSGTQIVTHDTLYGDVDQLVRFKTSALGSGASEFGLLASSSITDGLYWWAAYIVPGVTNGLRIQRVAPGSNVFQTTTINTPILAVDTWYWFRMQVRGGIRIRAKIWADGTDEPNQFTAQRMDYPHDTGNKPPLVGRAGVIVTGGTSLVQFDSYESTMWRAYGEVSNFPVRWDLSRQDRWVPIEAKGVLRRLGQGKKALESAVYRHLSSYTADAVFWHPLEEGGDSLYAPTPLENAESATVSGLTFGSDTTLIPGIRGYATLTETTDAIAGSSRPGIPFTQGQWTFLMFFRVPTAPGSSIPIATIKSTGNVVRWELTLNGTTMTINGYSAANSVLTTDALTLFGFDDIPTGSWIAMTLYVRTTPGTTTTWAVNYIRPGGTQFWTSGDNVFSGFPGLVTSYQISAVAATATAGGLSVAHIMAVNRDLPFVTDPFAKASAAYVGEYGFDRFIRLCQENGIPYSFSGFQNETEKMGPQLPAKVVALLEECAQASGAFLGEARENNSIEFRTRKTVMARTGLTLDIDQGHISAPCEPSEDDQATRNDVTINRTLGGFYRTVQVTGPLNTSAPEKNTGGVGVYDEAPEFNVATLAQAQPIGNFRLAKGTLTDVRYPNVKLDFTASAYQASDALVLAAASLEAGDTVLIVNPEVSPDPSPQLVYAYAETLDQFDWDMVLTTKPAEAYRAGLLNRTTRLDTAYSNTSATFISGTNTQLQVSRSDAVKGFLWVAEAQRPGDFPFDIMVSGVRLRVTGNAPSILVATGTFEANITGWLAVNGNVTLSRSTAQARTGSASLLMTAVSGTAALTGAATGPSAQMAPVTPGSTYTASAWQRAAQATADARLQVDFYQADGTTYITSIFAANAFPLVSGVWTAQSLQAVAPALAAFMSVRLRPVMTTGDLIYVDDVRVTAASSYASDPQTLIVEQTPVNGVIKTIPSGTPVRVQAPWRVAW